MLLTILGLSWLAGLLIGLYIDIPPAALGLFLAAAVALGLLLRGSSLPIWPAVAAAILLFGILRVTADSGPMPLEPSGALDSVAIRGQVVSDPELAGSAVRFVLRAEEIDRGNGRQEADDRVLVVARPPAELVEKRDQPFFRYGDVLALEGRLRPPESFGGFDYRAYLANQGIHSTLDFPGVELLDEDKGNPLRRQLYRFRRELAHRLDEALPPRQASLAQALLLGIRSDLPSDLEDDFRSSGTSHLLAISGLHVGVVLFIAIGASAFLLGRRRQLYLAAPLATIWLYALMSGLAPPVERAAIMGSIYLAALALGRPRSILPALFLAAGIMAGLEPHLLLDVSFQLSFASIAGIALALPHFEPLWGRFALGLSVESGWRASTAKAIAVATTIGLAATLATLPLIAFNFHRVPTLGILATVLALPAMPAILVTSSLAAVSSFIHPDLGQVVGWVAWIPLSYLTGVVHLIALIPGSSFTVPAMGNALVLSYYAVLALFLLMPGGLGAIGRLPRLVRHVLPEARGRLPFPGGAYLVILILVGSLAGILWFHVATGSDGKLHVTFLDVGQGDAILIVTPGGRRILVDGGPDPLDAARAVGDRIDFWDRHVDLLVLTHPDEDHFRGLTEVARRYDVGTVMEGGLAATNPLYLELERAVEALSVPRLQAFRGQRIELGEAVRLEVLHPPASPLRGTASEQNNNGAVLRLSYGNISFLLTADIEREAEASLLQSYGPLYSTVLKVAHHGSSTSSSPAFLAAVQPRLAIVSAGVDNPFGHPSDDVMARLRESLSQPGVYLTAEHGDIKLTTDGSRLWLRTER